MQTNRMDILISGAALSAAEKYGRRVAAALLLLTAGIVLVRLIGFWVQRAFMHSRLPRMPAGFLAGAVKCALWTVLAFSVAAVLGIPSTPLAAVIGSAGLALGLALKDSLSDLASGLILLGTKPFAAGDYVDVDGTEGSVKRIRPMTSELITPDNKTILLPNSTVRRARITNYSSRSTRRVDIPVAVAYGTDLAALRRTVCRELSASRFALADPAPVLLFSEAGASALVFSARVWVRQEDYWDAYRELGETLAARLPQAGFDVPYTQLHLRWTKPSARKEA